MTTNRKRPLKSEFALFQASTILFNFIQFVKNFGEIFWGWIRKLRKEKENVVSGTYFIKRAREIRKFRVAVVQRQLYKKCTGAWSVVLLLLFRCFSLPSPSSLLKFPNVVIQKFCYHGNVTEHFSSQLRGELEWKKVFHYLEANQRK